MQLIEYKTRHQRARRTPSSIPVELLEAPGICSSTQVFDQTPIFTHLAFHGDHGKKARPSLEPILSSNTFTSRFERLESTRIFDSTTRSRPQSGLQKTSNGRLMSL